MPREVVDCRPNTKDDIQDPCDPNELLGECARECEVSPGEDERDDQDEDEEDDGVRIEREVVACMVDSSAAILLVRAISLERKA